MSRFQAALIALLLLVVLPTPSAAQGVAAPGLAAPSPGVRPPLAAGQPSWHQDFEGPTTSWTDAGGDAQYTLVAHQRVRGWAHRGQGSEWIEVSAQGGNSVLIAHDIGRPRVIDDLRASIWIYADRPGIQFSAEVTLPRSVDPRSGKPLTTSVFAAAYSTAGRWQQIEIADFPRMVDRGVRILRSQSSLNIDGREAFVSRVLLNIYGGPGVTNVWTDDLEVFGLVPSDRLNDAETRRQGDAVIPISPPLRVSASPPPAAGPPPREVKLAGSVLTVNDHPIFPRCIEYRGENLAFLKQLGFNTIWLRATPPPAFLASARQLGLWLVCPPPDPGGQAGGLVHFSATTDEIHEKSSPENMDLTPSRCDDPPAAIGPEFEPVLVWDLGHGLTGDSLDADQQRAARVRLADSRVSRPLICAPVNNLRSYRHANLLLIDRRPLGTSLEMSNYGAWVQRQPLLAVLGTPVWTTVQTQAGEGLRRQFATLTPGRAPPTVVGPEQIRLLVYTAISSGSRGLLFLSDSSLEAQDDETRQRVMALELLNLELEVIEPWAAGGTLVGTAESSQRLVSGAVLRDDRARIVMPMWLAPGSQCVAPLAAANPLNLTLPPDTPESSNIFKLSAGRLEPLRHRRVAGGTQVTLDEFGLTDLLFLAEDPPIIEAVNRRAAANGRQIAELERYLAAQKYDMVTRVYAQIGNRIPPPKNPSPAARTPKQDIDNALENLKFCDARLAAGDYAMASVCARRAMMPLRKLERVAWEAAMVGSDSPVAIPGTSSFQALPWHWALLDRIAAMRPGANRLPGGDFENLEVMRQSGWRNFQRPPPGIQTAADLHCDAAHSGRLGLRLTARADNPEKPPAIIEMPPLWVTSPAVAVEAGQIVRIHGWVNVPAPIIGSVDGLLVVESLTGEEMALRLDKTNGWREFSMLRIVPQSGPLTLTFSLTGLGEVRLDDVTIEVFEPNRSTLPMGGFGSN